MEKFEYKIFMHQAGGVLGGSINYEEIETTLTGFGLVGWELVSVHPPAIDPHGKLVVMCYLKRKIKE